MHRSRLVLLPAILAIAVCSSVHATETQPATCRDLGGVAREAANALDTRYVDQESGAVAADLIRMRTRQGAFRSVCGNPEEQARTLTLAIRAALPDWHLRVAFRSREVQLERDAGTQQPNVGQHGVVEVKRLPGNIGLIRLSHFGDLVPSTPDLAAAMQLLAGASGIIVDLRGNRGGDGDTANAILRSFLPEGAPDTFVRLGRNGERVSGIDTPEPSWSRFPSGTFVIALVNRQSASAAEALAFGLQEERIGLVVGERTLGAGHELRLAVNLGNDFTLYVPDIRVTGRLSGNEWEGTGVKPDIECASDDAQLIAWRHLMDRLQELR